jgi:RNA polymerase sigma-70 factor, ECF subfamily
VEQKQERALIIAAQTGDSRAFSALYQAYVDKIYRYIFFRVESAEVAEDLTAEVFLRLVEGLKTYQAREIPLLVWLYRVAHARVVDHYRRGKRAAVEEPIDEMEIGVEIDLDESLLANYESEQLKTALLSLTDGQRQVIALRFVEGYNLETTARLLGKTIDSVKAMQYRALQTLAQALKRQGFKPER